ncbi:type II toxin-antitoxin system HigB family toxin [Flavobacterium gillisiae]|uniref:type II toxin-antitoxin system HigB family toxin n=1 Tax=Flavobacterium gillisiae TaxID=150146 RepID=UPI000B80EAB0
MVFCRKFASFNVKRGSSYRVIVKKINYEYQMVWIRFIGTHSEYDKINANEI